MAELTINIGYEREDDLFDINIEAYNHDGDDIQSELEYDKEFQDLLCALSGRFVEIVDQLDKENSQ